VIGIDGHTDVIVPFQDQLLVCRVQACVELP
jgi:hypothetical protein